MTYKDHALRSVFIIAFILAIAGRTPGSESLTLTEQTLQVVRDCMTTVSGPWPEAWQKEYIDTIHCVIEPYERHPDYAIRLSILRNGFPFYWEGLKKSRDRAVFEVHCAQTRWYTEHLMSMTLPDEGDRQCMRKQWQEFWHDAACSLLTQFSFLDPNIVHRAEADHLNACYRHIEIPLEPIYLRPFTTAQTDQIKQRWHDMRYARVDLWRQLGGEKIISVDRQQAEPFHTHPHYLLTQKCLAQLLTHIRSIVALPPEYYRRALKNRIDVRIRHQKLKVKARTQERRLENERSRQLQQTEYISFLLAALLETPQCFEDSLSIRTEKHDRHSSNRTALPKEVMPMP